MASPTLGFCAGASPVTEPEDRRLPLGVSENNHCVNEYAPNASGGHRIFRLLVTGSLRLRFLTQFVLGRFVECRVRGAVSLIALPVVVEVLARYRR